MGQLQHSYDSWEIRTMQTTDGSQLSYPIDAMQLMHKALRAEAARVEEAVNALEMGGSFKPFQRTFYRWAMALGYHMEMEEHYFTNWLPATLLPQEKEVGPGHVMERLEDLQTYLQEELVRMIVIPRSQRQLRSKVIALGIVQDDLFEAEEESVLPVIRQQLSESQQCDMAQRLLLDQEAQDTGWILSWLKPHVSTTERQWLTALMG